MRNRLPIVALVAIAVALLAMFAISALRGDDANVVEAADGTVKGSIVYEGKPPRMRPIAVEGDPNCAALHSQDKPLMTDWMLLGEGQTVANVLVYVVSGLPEGGAYPVPEESVDVTQQGCQYSPHVVAARAGQTVRFLNPDGLQHNIHLQPKVNKEFNMSMAKTRTEVTHVFKKAEPVFGIKCDVHSWMNSFCAVFDHPFYQITLEDGAYEIEGLPAGTYEIEAWHERLGTQRKQVEVKSGEAASVDFTFTRPKK